MTFGEALKYDIGTLNYLYFKLMKEAKNQTAIQNKQNEAMNNAMKGEDL